MHSPTPQPIRYQARVDAGQRNTTHTQIVELLGNIGKVPMRILDIGCSSGYLGGFLRGQGHWVAGIEPSPAAAAAARAVLDEVFEGGFDAYLADRPPQAAFDAIVFADVLEHLEDPALALSRCGPVLAPGGCVAISLPNIAHGGVRGMLLEGRWTYQELGILDRTHLRFFSRAGLIDLCDQTAFELKDLRAITMSVEEMDRCYAIGLSKGTIALVKTAARDADVNTFQFVALACPAADAASASAANARWRTGALASAEQQPRPPSRLRALRHRWRDCARAITRLIRQQV